MRPFLQPNYFFWEPLALIERLAITGFVQFIPANLRLARLTCGTLILLSYFALLAFLKPYLAVQIDVLASLMHLMLLVIFLASIQLRVFDLTEQVGLASYITGFQSKDDLGVFFVIITVMIMAIFLAVGISEIWKSQRMGVLRMVGSDQQPVLTLTCVKGTTMSYHLFRASCLRTQRSTADHPPSADALAHETRRWC